MDASATIVALATPPGSGAVAIVRCSGPEASVVAARLLARTRPLRARYATVASLIGADGAPIDEALALWMPGPRSYTGEDVLELQVHGSPAIVRETLAAAIAAGARLARPGEFTRRAFLNGKMDLSAAEAVADIIGAQTRSAARAAAGRLAGGLLTAIAEPKAQLAALVEQLSGSLDYPDEIPAPERAPVERELRSVDLQLVALEGTAQAGRLVREGAGAAIVGPPNAGKSSLLNALLRDDRALVSDVAGTTRDTVEETVIVGGIAVRLIDTAGLRESADELEAAGMRRTLAALESAALALVVIDGSRELEPGAHEMLERTRAMPRVVVFSKRDLGTLGYDRRDAREAQALCVSTRDRAEVASVADAIAEALGEAQIDLERPHLATARQIDCIARTRAWLGHALETLERGDSLDLLAADLARALAALRELSGDAASEAVLDGVFARFCVGK